MRSVRSIVFVFLQTYFLFVVFFYSNIGVCSEPDVVTKSENCDSVNLDEFLTANIQHPVLPLVGKTRGWRITQRYNTWWDDPDRYKAGHNGLDVGGEYGGSVIGKEKVYSAFPGQVVISRFNDGWGNSITIASKVNRYSDEIITLSYHHLDKRFVASCNYVYAGDLIGMEGKSGDNKWLAHLHLTVRRWANKEHLLHWLTYGKEDWHNAYLVFGSNAYFGHNGKMFKGSYDPGISNIVAGNPYYEYGHLNPDGLLRHYFLDFQTDNAGNMVGDKNLMPFVMRMQRYGIEFGHFDGSYGALDHVKRRELARWLKIASMQDDLPYSPAVTFDDVPFSDPDFPYIEVMSRYPSPVPVINPHHSCTKDGHTFCPDRDVNRAEALKMTVLAFYNDEYQAFYKKYFWQMKAGMALQSLAYVLKVPLDSLFSDVPLGEWFASYVYFGIYKGIVAMQPDGLFRPADPVSRQEMAKWVTLGYEYLNSSSDFVSICDDMVCAKDEFCDAPKNQCSEIAYCVPSETLKCEVGGGYDACEQDAQCSSGESESQSWGNGGTQTGVCGDDCQWGEFGQCVGGGECTTGQSLQCGNCGTMVCGSNHHWGACLNQGVCSPGYVETVSCNGVGTKKHTCEANCSFGAWSSCSAECSPGQTQSQSCSSGGYSGTQSRTCDSSGHWGPFGSCVVSQECSPGQTQSQSCSSGGYSGTQSRTCDSSGHWGPFGSCVVNCECSSGICCDGCHYDSSAFKCKSWYEYRCEGSNPGNDAQKQLYKQYCSGHSAGCDGAIKGYGWTTKEDCSSSQVCEMNNGVPQCVADTSCSDQFLTSSTHSCYSNPSGAGNPTLCMDLQHISGSSWRYRVCKSGSSFGNQFDYRLVDDHYLIHFTRYTENAGVSCSSWHSFDVKYINGYGASNGAGLKVEVRSPAGCIESGCQYSTGVATIRKECL